MAKKNGAFLRIPRAEGGYRPESGWISAWPRPLNRKVGWTPRFQLLLRVLQMPQTKEQSEKLIVAVFQEGQGPRQAFA